MNYPTTEFLEVAWADVATFNVYLEQPDLLAAYIARLQNVAREPLLRLGLSATQKPVAEVAQYLVGAAGATGSDRAAGCLPK